MHAGSDWDNMSERRKLDALRADVLMLLDITDQQEKRLAALQALIDKLGLAVFEAREKIGLR